MIKTCTICGKEFEAVTSAKCCSSVCRLVNKRRKTRQWRVDNPELNRVIQKVYRETHKDYYNQYQKGFWLEHPGYRKQSDKLYKARKRFAKYLLMLAANTQMALYLTANVLKYNNEKGEFA